MATSNTISILIKAIDQTSPAFASSLRSLNAIGTDAASVGRSLDRYVSLPIAGVAAASLKMAGDFEQSLNVLQSVTGATAGQMTSLRQEARDLGNDISLPGISAKDAAGAMTELAKAGLNVNDVMSASKGVLSLAKAGQIDVSTAALTTARALNAFNLSGDQANRIADLLAASANASSSSVSDMALGLQMAGAQSHAMGVSLQDTVTALAEFSNAGINGSDAGTSLKQMFLQLASPSKEAAGLMKQLNLQFFDAKGNFVGLSSMAQMLQDRLGGLTVEQRNNALATIFGSDATRVATILAQGGAAAFDKMSTAVNKQGAATDLAAAQNKGFNGALDNLKSTAETAMIDIGTNLLPLVTNELKKLTDEVGRVSAWFSSLTEEQQSFIFKTLEIAAVLGPTILILGKFATSISAIMTVTTSASKALGLFKTTTLVSEAALGSRALGAAGLAGAAEGATGAIAGSGGLLAAMGPIGLALGGAAVIAGGAYLAYKQFSDAGKDAAATTTGMFQPVSLLTLAQQAQKQATDNVTNATNNVKAAQDSHKATVDQLKVAHDNLSGAQANVKLALDTFGANSPQYQAAVQQLSDKQNDYNGKLLNEWGLSVNVHTAEDDLVKKRGELQGATGALKDMQDRLNGGLDSGVNIIYRFGPAAAAQVGAIDTLQVHIGAVVNSWNGWNGQLQSQLPNQTKLLQGLGSNIDRVQGQGSNLVNTLQHASQLQVSTGSGLQGSGAKLQGHALGTNYAPGGSTLVGENGPEIVDLPRGSRVRTAEESRNASFGQQVTNVLSGNFTFNDKGAVDEFFSRLDKTQRLAQLGMAS